MDERQTVDEDCHVIPVGVGAVDLVLVDDLQPVVVDVDLVEQVDILHGAVVAFEDLDVVFLDPRCLLGDPVVRGGDLLGEEALPLGIREVDIVQGCQLRPQIRLQRVRARHRQVLVRLASEQLDERRLERRLGLVGAVLVRVGHELGDDRAFVADRDRLEARRRACRHHGTAPSGPSVTAISRFSHPP